MVCLQTKISALKRVAEHPRVFSGYLCDGSPACSDDDKTRVCVEKHWFSSVAMCGRIECEKMQDLHSKDFEVPRF